MSGVGRSTVQVFGLALRGLPRLQLLESSTVHTLPRRDAALLMWLALLGPQPRARMAEWLWPDVPAAKAQTNLRQRLFRFRKDWGLELGDGADELRLPPELNHDLQSDVAPAADGAVEPELLGSLDFSDSEDLSARIELARTQWREQRHGVLAARAEQLEAEGRLAEALRWAQQLTLNTPHSEHAHRRVMRLHYRRGDRGAALTAWQHCHDCLKRGLDVSPSAETAALAELIERSQALPAPAAFDASGAQVTKPVNPPVLQAALRRPPLLVGREAAWQDLARAQGSGQLVVLVGEAGIGKSRLAEDFTAPLGQT